MMVQIGKKIKETKKAFLVTLEGRDGEYWVAKSIIHDDHVDDSKYELKDVSKKVVVRVEFEKEIEAHSEKSIKAVARVTWGEEEEGGEAELFIFFAKSMVVVLDEHTMELEEWIWESNKERSVERLWEIVKNDFGGLRISQIKVEGVSVTQVEGEK